MTKKEWKIFSQRYDKFRNNTLPTPFWDEERQTFEYVWFWDGNYQTSNDLLWPLAGISVAGLYYPYTIKTMESGVVKIGHSHSHSFEEVVRALYSNPESFKIAKKEEEYYSAQELNFLRRVQKYLLFIGLKDIDPTKKVPANRYRNKKAKKYLGCAIYRIDSEKLKKIRTGQLDFLVWDYYQGFESKVFKKGEFQALLVDQEDNFIFLVEFTTTKLLKYKEIKNIISLKNKTDNAKIVANYFKIIEKY